MRDDTLPVITARCCTDWTVLRGIGWRKCGDCHQRPVAVPGTERDIPAPPPTQGRAPKLVAVVKSGGSDA